MQLRRRLHFHPAAESACRPWQPAAASWKSHRVAPLLQSDSAAATQNFDRLELHRTRKARESHHMFLWESFVQLRTLNRDPARAKETLELQPEQREKITQSVEPAEPHS